MKIHHIGYLIQDMAAAVNTFKNQGWKIQHETIFDEAREIFICFMENSGVVIELVQPSENYHICYLSGEADFDGMIEKLQAQGNFLVQPPQNAVALENRKVVFFMNEATGLFEVIDEKNTLDNSGAQCVSLPRAKSQEPRAIIIPFQNFSSVKKHFLRAA